MVMSYQLGSSEQEQARLIDQAEVYNDKQYFQLESHMKICEFGCGNGANLWIAEKLVDGHYIGIDIQQRQVAAATKKAALMQLSNVNFHHVNAAKVPVESYWADLAFCRLVLVHNPEPLELIREMSRVVKSGSRVLAIEPNNLSYIAYNKPFLNKCYHARVQYMYQPGKGCLNICSQLYHLFNSAELYDINIKQHNIYTDSRNPALLKWFYENWVGMLSTVKDQLIGVGAIDENDYQHAIREAAEINAGDSLYQSLWVAEGVKR